MNILLDEAAHWGFVRIVGAGQPVEDQLKRWSEADTPLAEALAISIGLECKHHPDPVSYVICTYTSELCHFVWTTRPRPSAQGR